MEIELRALLLADTALDALVAGRVDWVSRPPGTPLPAVVLHRVGGGEGYTLKGKDGLHEVRVQADCIGDTIFDAYSVSNAVLGVLSGYRGGNFLGVFHDGTRDDREGGTNEPSRSFRRSVDFLINWKG
jgi:hypothetical protein